MDANNKFKIEFILFEKNKILTDLEINQKNKLLHIDMKKILNFAIDKLGNYKLIDTNGLTILNYYCKQLKLSMDTENNENIHSIYFLTSNYDEFKKLIKQIKNAFELYFNKKINIFVTTEILDLNSDSEEKLKKSVLGTITNINYII